MTVGWTERQRQRPMASGAKVRVPLKPAMVGLVPRSPDHTVLSRGSAPHPQEHKRGAVRAGAVFLNTREKVMGAGTPKRERSVLTRWARKMSSERENWATS